MSGGGTTIGRYELLSLLGAGGGGQVHRARDPATGQEVALKLVQDPGDDILFKRFRREVKVLQTLKDRHIVRYVDADLGASPPYLAMELVPGASLSALLEDARDERPAPFPHARARTWAADIARGLAAAHRAHVLHRDLKPGNVMIDAEDRAVLVDFGLAKTESTANPSLTGPQAVTGTLRYMAPEQLDNRPLSPATDVYQWGLVVHELLSGALPYPDVDPIAALHMRASYGVPDVSVADPALGPLVKLMGEALAPDPASRPASGAVLLERLERLEPATPVARAAAAREPSPQALENAARPYRLVRLLGKGGMGSVYEGRHESSGERVAVKFIHPGLTADDEGVKRFLREARIMARLASPRVVRLLDVRGEGEHPLLVMEFLEGETLAARLAREGAIPAREAIALEGALVAGLADLHRQGIVHRDLKPANVLLTPRSGPKLLDLGLARDLSITSLTVTGSYIGTPMYAPPELQSGALAAPTADVFMIMLMFFEMVTGRRDFRGPDAPDTLRGFLLRDRALQRDAGVELTSELVELFRRATATAPALRPGDGVALHASWQLLEARYRELGSGPSRKASAPVASPPPPDPKASGAAQRAWQGAVWMGRFAFALVVLAIGVAAVLVLPELLRRGAH